MRNLLACLLLLSLPLPAVATGAEVESGAVSTVIAPGIAYNPTGIEIGSYLYLYVQTGDSICTSGDVNGPLQGDVIQAFRAPVVNGVPGAFSSLGRISPCLPSIPATSPARYASFGPGQIFQATLGGSTAYHLLADESDQSHFHEIWHGWTANGTDWTWEVDAQPACTVDPLNPGKTCADPKPTGGSTTVRWKPVSQPFLAIAAGLGIGIVNPVMLSTSSGANNATWWGYLKYVAGSITTTAMEVTFDASSHPQVYLLTAKTPSFTYAAIGGNLITTASQLFPLVPQANAKSLLYDATSGGYQLWGDYPAAYNRSTVGCRSGFTVDSHVLCVDPTPTGACGGGHRGCPTEGGCVAEGASPDAFDTNTAINHAGSALFWWPATPTSLGDAGFVGSYSRNLPSGYAVARLFPFRWNSPNGTRYLFSATNDDNICSALLYSEFAGMYVVESRVSPYP